MSDDSLAHVCEDLLQLRDEVGQSEFRPPADEICQRLTLAVKRIEACYSQPQAESSEAGDDHGETHYQSAEATPVKRVRRTRR